MKFHEVPVYLESKTVEIRKNSVVIETKEGRKEILANSVITSIVYVQVSDELEMISNYS
ncbi:hypothetical protein [Lachnotalea glycerini]|uniref:hypothetical protein n=1 Tax=Lachnotalea glycerini TaxID=1763509 RepID=UPI0014740356|nr:hypothetical protein [Lachnotalea glycerini]